MASTAFESATTIACACSVRRGPPLATERTADARQQLQRVAGLEDDVVRAGVERTHAVVERGPLGQRQHRQRRRAVVGTQSAQQLERVQTRHRERQDQEVGLVFVDRVQAVLAIGDSVDVIAGPRKDLPSTRDERPSHPR